MDGYRGAHPFAADGRYLLVQVRFVFFQFDPLYLNLAQLFAMLIVVGLQHAIIFFQFGIAHFQLANLGADRPRFLLAASPYSHCAQQKDGN